MSLLLVVQEVDKAVIPAVAKARLRDGQARVQRRILEAAKASVAANKAKAIKAATKAAEDVVSSNKTFLVLQLHVALDDSPHGLADDGCKRRGPCQAHKRADLAIPRKGLLQPICWPLVGEEAEYAVVIRRGCTPAK